MKARRKGYVLVLMTVCVITMTSFLGLAIDVGYMQYTKTKAQVAADAAADAAAIEAGLGSSTGTITTAGQHGAALNGFTTGSGGVTVTINHPPTGGTYASNTSYYEAIVAQSTGTFFMRMAGFSTLNVSARAVAKVGTTASTACVYVLDSNAQDAFKVSGSSDWNSACGIQVNSSDDRAMKISGSSSVTATAINIVGDYQTSGSSSVSPTPTTGAASKADPFASWAVPSYSTTCTQTNYHPNSNTTLSPGTYCDGIKLSGSNTYTFSPGTYILLGGGLDISGSSTVSGSGVSFYNTYDSSHSYKSIKIAGSADVTFSAPTSGSWEAMLFVDDRTGSGDTGFQVSGSSNPILTGVLYFPNEGVKYSGSSAASYTILICNTLQVSGSSTMNSDYSSLSHGNPISSSSGGKASLGE